jgi:hypothetical protein
MDFNDFDALNALAVNQLIIYEVIVGQLALYNLDTQLSFFLDAPKETR